MKTEMKEIGDLLKQRRKEMNVSLKEVENATSIRINYLQSIEEGEVKNLISPIYAKGFLKQYAAFLGIDGEKIVEENPHLFNKAPLQEFSYGIGTLEMRGHPGGHIKWFPNALWILLSAGVITLAWFVAHYLEVI